jgi:glucose dehydrogenase
MRYVAAIFLVAFGLVLLAEAYPKTGRVTFLINGITFIIVAALLLWRRKS